MTDMSQHIAPKSDQLNSDDMIGGALTVTITKVVVNTSGSGADQPVNVFFENDGGKPFRPCKSMRRVMVAIWGKDAAQYAGRSMTLYRDPDVTWGGMKVGGIRISHMSDMEKPEIMALTSTQKQRKPYRVDPLVIKAAPTTDSATLSEARAEATKGSDQFRAWFKANPGKRADAQTIMGELQAAAKLADESAAIADDDADPFGLPPIDDDAPKLTPAQIAEIQREIAESNERESA